MVIIGSCDGYFRKGKYLWTRCRQTVTALRLWCRISRLNSLHDAG